MGTLLMRLAAPLQSWGADSKFDIRRTATEPTKSGVIGLLAAALGVPRDDERTVAELRAMRFGVRADREGVVIRDFHMARHPAKEKIAFVTQRYYLSDAVFVAGLECADAAYLQTLGYALCHPAYPLFLGRRSCPPAGRVFLGVSPESLEDALRLTPLQAAARQGSSASGVRVLTDSPPAARNGAVRRDAPVSYSPAQRLYGFRQVEERRIIVGMGVAEHDPMAELE